MTDFQLMTTRCVSACCCFLLVTLATDKTAMADDQHDVRPNDAERWKQIIAVENVCAWPNLTRLPDGTITAFIFNKPTHGQGEGDIDCWASSDGVKWERRSTVTQHKPNTIRMNCAAGLAKNGDLVVLCAGWTNEKQADRPKQIPFRDAIVRSWVLRSSDGGRTWSKHEEFPEPETGWNEYVPFGDI